jgi:uncharacterized protein (DUF2345 family)
MLNNILSILDRLGSHSQNRAIHITLSNSLLNTKVVLQRIDGYQGINEGQSAELICLATDPYIELKQFIGCQVAIDQVTDQGQLFRTTGIITGASQGQSDGAFSLFRLTLQDPTALWHKRRNSRVFMNKSVIEIIEIIFKEWQDKSKLFASSLKLDLSGLGQTYDVRPFSMQSSESEVDEPDLEPQETLKNQFEKWNKNNDALVALHSESGMILDSKESIHIESKDNIDVSTSKNLQFFTGKSWIAKALNKISIFAKHAGIKIKSGEGNIDVTAQKGKMTLSSKEQMHVYSLNEFVRVESGKGILITSGGGYIKIEGGNIEIACPGLIELKAGQVKVQSGTSLSSQLPKMPELKSQYDEHFILHYPDGEPAKNLKYKITAEDGQIFEGISDENGKTSVYSKDAMSALNIEVFSPE